jgi:hypothetical protein
MLNTKLVIELTESEAALMKSLMQKRGYDAPADYVKALIHEDAEIESESVDEDDDDDEIRESIKQGFREALRDEGTPIDDVWANLDDE